MEKIFLKKIDNNHNNYIYIFEKEMRDDIFYGKFSKKVSSSIDGLASDGLIVFTKLSNKKYYMKIFNSDGSKANMCGNGLKGGIIFLESIGEIENLKDNDFLFILTDSGVKKIIKYENNYLVNIGSPIIDKNFKGLIINFLEFNFLLYSVDIGNKHFIYFFNDNYFKDISQFYSFNLDRLFIFTHENFFYNDWKNGTEVVNVSIVYFFNNNVYIRTYERGSKETFACGTASASTAFILFNCFDDLKDNLNIKENAKNIDLIINSTYIDLFHKGGIIRNYNYNDLIYQKVNSHILFEGYYYYEE
ncbi:MAG: hypothetical protein N3A58_03270 [Spirochaetes bacterium]|nr:hypothetical protein [Spirochaetota bacterium]